MTLIFPRDMVSAESWYSADFRLQRSQEISRTSGGQIQARDLAPSYWRATFLSVPLEYRDAIALRMDFETLGGALRPFNAATLGVSAPAQWSGEDLSTVTVAEISADRTGLRLDGLPAGFELTAGDYLTVSKSGATELHGLARGGIADGAGLSPLIHVVPKLRPVVSVGDSVALQPPFAEMLLEPGTLASTRHSAAHWQVSFEAVQVLR